MAPIGESTLFQYGTGEKGHGVTEDGQRRLKQPRGVSIGADGALLVADFGGHCVVSFGQNDVCGKVVAGESGKMLPTVDILKDIDRPLGPAEGEGLLMKRPVDVCSHNEGGVLVLDNEVCRLQHYTSPDEKAATVVPPPSGPPQKSVNNPESVKYPRSMLLRPSGDVVICDTWSHRVLCYAPGVSTPEVLAGKSNSSGPTPEQMCFPSGIAFDVQGRLFVTDTNNHRVQCFEPGQTTGTTVAGSVEGVPGAGLNELNMPTGLCIDARDGSLLVADRMNGRVLRFPAFGAKQGEVVVGPKQQLERPWGVCQDAAGAIYVSDERKCIVLKAEAPKPLASSPPQKPLLALPVAPKLPDSPKQTEAPKQAVATQQEEAPKQGYPARSGHLAEAPKPAEEKKDVKDLHPCAGDQDAMD